VRPHRADEVRRRRDGLGNQHRGGQAGLGGGPAQGVAALGAPGRRVGERHMRGCRVRDALRLRRHAPQHRRDELGRPEFAIAEVHGLLVDAALRVRLEAMWMQSRRVDGVAAGEDSTVFRDVDRRREDGCPVEEQRLRPAVRPSKNSDGIRRTEVDA